MKYKGASKNLLRLQFCPFGCDCVRFFKKTVNVAHGYASGFFAHLPCLDRRDQNFASKEVFRGAHNFFLASLSGLITIFVFPYSADPKAPYLGWMAFFSLAPLCYAVIGSRTAGAFFEGFVTAFIYFLGSLSWMYAAVHDFAGYPAWAAATLVLACASALATIMGTSIALAKFLSGRLKMSLIVLLPFAWMLAEYARTYFPFDGFPWNNIAYSLHGIPALMQIADITGIYFLTFLLVLSNVSLASLVRWFIQRRCDPLDKLVFAAPALVALAAAYGLVKLHSAGAFEGQRVTVAAMHGATPQALKNNRAEGQRQISVFTDLSRQAVLKGADLLIWPETIFVGHAIRGARLAIPIENFGKPLIVGSATYQPGFNLSNSALLVGADGLIEGVQDKTHLVPFGEYVPAGFFFMRRMVKARHRIIPGRGFNLFESGPFKTGVLICYEDAFPDIARRFVRDGANFLTVISNDGWFEGTSASLQHLVFSAFRAVENRRPLVRSSNRGVSAIISPLGKIMDSESAPTEVALMGEIAPRESMSAYTRFGDWFICFSIVVMSVWGLTRRKKCHDPGAQMTSRQTDLGKALF